MLKLYSSNTDHDILHMMWPIRDHLKQNSCRGNIFFSRNLKAKRNLTAKVVCLAQRVQLIIITWAS